MKQLELKLGAGITFIVAFITYVVTLAPTVPFWDCGEFIACAVTMGVPHPPGAPLYLMISKLFSFLPIGDPAYRINLLSALASSFTIMILYLIIVRLIKEFIKEDKSLISKLSIYFAALIGAMTYTFSDSFWFNAVESEVYGISVFIMSLVMWMTMLWMDNYKKRESLKFIVFISYMFGLAFGVHLLALLAAPSLLLLVYFYDKKIFFNWRLLTVIAVLVIIAMSTYTAIYVRSGLEPVINENNPSTIDRLVSYWNREQYGTQGFAEFQMNRQAPTWDYQVKKMFVRYFAWNFIGKGTTLGEDRYIQEIISPKGLFFLPFLLGVFGMYFHFRKDWRRALAILFLFLIMGPILVIYFNQPDPQPRERDYFYIGNFFAFSIWIGMGVAGIFDFLRKKFVEKGKLNTPILGIAAGLIFICGPVLEFQHNAESHDRRGNYMAWDYSYNLLNSCEPNSLLFTNGDNDTFPIWYLQEVENIRKDITVINLSLLNTEWYIKQLKRAKNPVAISLNDDQINVLTPIAWKEQQITVNVPVNVYNEMIKEAHPSISLIPVQEQTTISFNLAPTFAQGQAIRVQDRMILNILYSNNWQRPIYFAMTIPSSNRAGLDNYLRLSGLAMKLVPYSGTYYNADQFKQNLMEVFQYRKLADPSVFLDSQNTDLIQNYRYSFFNLANFYHRNRLFEDSISLLDFMESVVPESKTPLGNPMLGTRIAQMYSEGGNNDKAQSKLYTILEGPDVTGEVKVQVATVFAFNLDDKDKAIEICKEMITGGDRSSRAFSLVLTLYDQTQKYKEGIELLDTWLAMNPADESANTMKTQFQARLAEADTSK